MGANFKWHGLLDLTGKWRLSVECRCGHAGAFDPEKLARYFMCHGWSTAQHEITQHLYCSACRKNGRNGRMRVGITAGEPTSDPFPQNEESWKFLVRRLRNR